MSAPLGSATALVGQLRAQGLTVAAAESLTGGLLASALVDVAGSSSAFRGGVVAYDSAVKVALLGVNADLVARQGVVNAEVAVAMALGVAELLECDLGIATTGVAGPGPSMGVDQGRVFVAAVMTQGGTATSVVRELVLGGTRAVVRGAATRAALALAHSLVEQSVEPGRSAKPEKSVKPEKSASEARWSEQTVKNSTPARKSTSSGTDRAE